MHKHTSMSLVIAMIATMLPFSAIAQTPEPYEQDFVITAYYSPLPDQCCYVKGSYEADKVLNGEGTHAADGTPVYPGMIAAPPSYAFGTRIELPGLGVFTVHDRGGAIQEWDNAHRLDIWMGHGEEGLARALAFGKQTVRGTIYPAMAENAPENMFDVNSLQANLSHIQPYAVSEEGEVVATENVAEPQAPRWGMQGEPVRILQEQLLALGYFAHDVTSYFGDVTRASLSSFMADMGLSEPSDMLTDSAQTYLRVAMFFQQAPSPVAITDATSAPSDIKKTQRYLRHLGYYRGRTDGVYSANLASAIIAFQLQNGLIGSETSPGAGRIGPLTKGMIDRGMLLKRVASYMKKWTATAVADSGAMGTL